MKHYNINFQPDGTRITIHAGATLLEAAAQAGIILNTVCGGSGTCRKCLVNIAPGGEQVLACQYHIDTDLTVTIPSTSRFYEQKILTSAAATEAGVQPDVFEKYRKIAPAGKILGLAVDIGTTTVVTSLIDMENGKSLATQAALNPQSRYGDDVISRINYAQTEQKLAQLGKTIIACINQLIDRLCGHTSVEPTSIYEMCVVGNTTMSHIFLGLPVKQLGRAPFNAFSLDAADRSAGELGIKINPASNVHTVENIAGFVGSDTVAVALAVDVSAAEEMTLVVDIGTNGELILGTKDKLYAASCAAGPAFEGARINQGSTAADGAIEAVIINADDIDVDVIGNCPPRSICGSGLIDAVAVLLDLGVIDPSGRFVESQKLKRKLPEAILSRITERNGQPAFCLARDPAGAGPAVILTQRDIRETQLAKAAIRAGINLLLKKFGIKDSEIKKTFLAGAFGSYIRRESALRIGLLPDISPERIHFLGNAAAFGARMILLNSALRAEAKQLTRRIEYVEIAHQPDFEAVFAKSMLF